MKLVCRGAAAGSALALAAFVGLSLVAVPPASFPASAAATALYAYAGGGAANGASDCPGTTTAGDQCTLAQALALAGAGDTVYLATPGSSALYIGNWDVAPKGTSASGPLTIEPAPGVTNPTLDGDGTSAGTCQTASCYGPVLTIGDAYVVIDDITIQHAYNIGYNPDEGGEGAIAATAGQGGAIDNSDRGTVTVDDCNFFDNISSADGGAIGNGVLGGKGALTVTGSSFTDNYAIFADGGAIGNGDSGTGALTVTATTFSGNGAPDGDGGAIDNGGNDGNGALDVSTTTFTGNSAAYNGGAIDNGDHGGTGALTVSTTTFSGNSATGSDGGAIDSGDNYGTGDLSVTTSTLSANNAGGDGGAVDEGDSLGTGTASIVASTLAGNVSNDGAAVNNGDNGGSSTLTVAADIFSEAASAAHALCHQGGGTWTDDGYNVASDPSCFSSPPAGTDNDSAGGSLGTLLEPLAANGGPTETIFPLDGNPAVGIIPDETPPVTVDVGNPDPTVTLCPTTDQRGVASLPGEACEAGSVQVGLPVAQDHAYSTTEGTELTETAGTLQTGVVDVNPGATSWTAQLVNATADGTVVVNPDGSFAYTPGAGFVGTDSFTYTLTDNLGFSSAPATVTVYVGPVFAISVNGSSTAATTTYGAPVTVSESGVRPGTTGLVGFVTGFEPATLCTLAFPTTSTSCPSSVDLAPGPYTVSANLTSTATNTVTSSVNTVVLTVDPATLTVTASSAVMTYGGTVPVITPSYSGFVDGQGVSSLTAGPNCSTTATSSSPPGNYPSTCTGAVNPDYAFSYVAGTVTVSPVATLTSSPGPATTTTTSTTTPASATTSTAPPPMSSATTTASPSTTGPPAAAAPPTSSATTKTSPSTTGPPATATPPTTSPPTTTSPARAAPPVTANPPTTAPAPSPTAPAPMKKPKKPSTAGPTTTTAPTTTTTRPTTTAPTTRRPRRANKSASPSVTSTSTPTTSAAGPKSSPAKTTTSSSPPLGTTTTTVAKQHATATTAARTTDAVPPTTTPPSDPGVLAFTGINAGELVGFASALGLLGCALVLASTRRRRNSQG